MNADLSVAPEIAQLATPLLLAPRSLPRATPRTDGRHAAQLSELAADPKRWWDLVPFDPGGPLRIPVPGIADCWLLVLPPGAAIGCECRHATLLAGEAAEAGRPLRPGRIRVHGGTAAHRVAGAGHGYSVSLHRAAPDAGITPGRVTPGE